MGYAVHGKEGTDDLIKRFEKAPKKVIVCLDELDHLKDYDFLYSLARSSNCCGLVFISNQAFTLSSIDNRIKSGLLLEEIEFKPYSRDEILAILKERALYGLRAGSISENLISIVANMSNGDARIGLQTLKIAAKDAESKDHESITIDEIKAASKCARKYRLSYLFGKLNDHQRIIYSILKKSRNMESGKLFDEYERILRQRAPPRSYRHYMQKMQEIGLVKEHGTGRWKRYEIVV